jgi:flagellar biogenesis protein FliO
MQRNSTEIIMYFGGILGTILVVVLIVWLVRRI